MSTSSVLDNFLYLLNYEKYVSIYTEHRRNFLIQNVYLVHYNYGCYNLIICDFQFQWSTSKKNSITTP